MIHPRVLFNPPTNEAAASPWVGLAKKLGRQTYKAGILNKTYRITEDVIINVHNVLAKEKSIGGICTVWIQAGGIDDFLSVAWTPEGIMLTPKGSEAPYGYGFPKRELSQMVVDENDNEYLIGGGLINGKFGTKCKSKEGATLNQVIINQYENNRYLDKKEFIVGLPTKNDLKAADKILSPVIDFPEINRRLRATIETEVKLKKFVGSKTYLHYWPIFFNPPKCDGDASYWIDIFNDEENPKYCIDEPGLNHYDDRNGKQYFNPFIDEPLYRQGKKDNKTVYKVKYRQYETPDGNSYLRNQLIYEEETENWFCHWPEELLYDNDAYETIFYLTNQYRSMVGEKPLFREIRGFPNTARMAVMENVFAEKFYHNNDAFRQGYQKVIDRTRNAASNIDLAGENLEAGFSMGLSIESGRRSAEGWRYSPLHYANMIHSEWSNPEGATSHEIYGAQYGKATDTQNGPADPPIKGGFWGQLFTKRKYWVLAGTVNQQTDAGRLSVFGYDSPIGNYKWEELFKYCVQGRVLNLYPANELYDGYFDIVTIGGCLYYKNDQVYVRVILFASMFGWYKKLYSFTRPLRNESCENWEQESVYDLEENDLPQDQCTFNIEGSKGVFTIVRKSNVVASHLFSGKKINEIDTTFYGMQVFTVTDGVIELDHEVEAPDASYEVVTQDHIEGILTYRWINTYKQYGSGEIEYHPFIDPETNEIAYLKFTFDYSCEQARDSFLGAVVNYTASCRDKKELTFNSGYKMVIAQQTLVDNGSKYTPPGGIEMDILDMEGDCFCIAFLYLDPIHEDMVYTKTTFRGDGVSVYGFMDIYVRHDGEERIIKHWEEKLINPFSLKKPHINGAWEVSPNDTTLDEYTIASEVINPAVNQTMDAEGRWYPCFDLSVFLDKWNCSTTPNKKIYPGKIIDESIKVDLMLSAISFTFCNSVNDSMNFTYNSNLRLLEKADGIICNAARYKDRFVTQIEFNQDHPNPIWTFPYDEKYLLYANFPLEDEVGMPIEHIEPFGVV